MHIRSSFDPGGTETLLLNLFNFSQDGFRIYLVLLKDGSLVGLLDNRSGNSFYKWYRKRFLDLSILYKMHGLIRKEKIDIVHTHQFIELCYAVILRLLNPKITVFHHIHLLFKKKDFAFLAERYLSQTFAKVLTVSHAAKSELIDRFGFSSRKIDVLYNGVAYAEKVYPDRINQVLKPGKNRFNIVMVANFVWGKDHAAVFEAYDMYIRKQLPEVSLYFIGRETDISEALKEKHVREEDLESGRIHFCGPVPDAKSLLPAFDLAVVSSYSETFNIALIEALCAGMTVLASDIPVFSELSEQGKYFHHFKTGDPLDFFIQLKKLLTSHQSKGENGTADHFKQKFAFDSFVNGLYDLYQHETLT